MPKCGSKVRGGGAGGNGFGCGKAIREEALEALGRKWHWECFVCDVSVAILLFNEGELTMRFTIDVQ
jgi:hypothetical protein